MPCFRKLLLPLARPVRQRPLTTILVFATLLRVGIVCWKFENLTTDTDSYLAIAANLLKGEGFCSVPGQPTAFRPPLYPLFVSACLLLGGTFGLAAAQVILGSATCGLAWLLAKRLKLSERACLLTALAVSVDPLLLIYTSHAMTETLVTFLVTLLLVVSANKASPQRSATLGFLFGLTVLGRPSLWAFGGLASGLFLLRHLQRRSPKEPFRHQITKSAPLLLGVLVTISPWVIRNWIVFGQPIIMTTHGGYTLLLANNPVFYEEVVREGGVWQKASLEQWQQKLNSTLAQSGIRMTDEVARDSAMRQMAIQNIQRSPGCFARSCLTRILRFWGLAPRTSSMGLTLWLLVASWYAAVLTYFVIGLVQIGRIDKHVKSGLLVVFSLTIVHSVFWSNARMRAPVTAVVTLLAASSVFPRNPELESASESAQFPVL